MFNKRRLTTFLFACLTTWLFFGSADAEIRKKPYLIYNGVNTEMTVLWQLQLTKTSKVELGLDESYSLVNDFTDEFGSDHQHSYKFTSLMPKTKYYYRVTVDSESYNGSFYTAPLPDDTKLKFMAYGDSRSNTDMHNKVAGAIVNTYTENSDFQTLIFSTGDLVDNGNIEEVWDNQFFNSGQTNIQELLANVPFQASMGNHENRNGGGNLFKKYLPYPFVEDRYWSFDYGPAHFVIIDQYADYSEESNQLLWVEQDLISTAKQWKFVFLHEPGWSSGGNPNNVTVQTYLQPLFEKYDVTIVFGGHIHNYTRANVNGVYHITTGGGGAELYSPNYSNPNIITASESYHFCKIEINGPSLIFLAVNPEGMLLDSFEINRNTASSNSPTNKSDLENPNSGGGCFIATAAYGPPIEPHIKILREFRDGFPLTNSVCSVLIGFVGFRRNSKI